MRSFYEPLFSNIIAKVDELIDAAKKKGFPVNFIFMVGGFSESPFLKMVVKNRFEEAGI